MPTNEDILCETENQEASEGARTGRALRVRNCQVESNSGGAAVSTPRQTSVGSEASISPVKPSGGNVTTNTDADSCFLGRWYWLASKAQQPSSSCELSLEGESCVCSDEQGRKADPDNDSIRQWLVNGSQSAASKIATMMLSRLTEETDTLSRGNVQSELVIVYLGNRDAVQKPLFKR